MEKKIGLAEARREFSRVINEVQYGGESYIISKHGEEAAAVVPLEVYRAWQQERGAFFDTIRSLQGSADLDPEEAGQLAEEALRASRSEQG